MSQYKGIADTTGLNAIMELCQIGAANAGASPILSVQVNCPITEEKTYVAVANVVGAMQEVLKTEKVSMRKLAEFLAPAYLKVTIERFNRNSSIYFPSDLARKLDRKLLNKRLNPLTPVYIYSIPARFK
jgi:hypothetical protein